jgi:hypothetical protein
MRRTEDSTVPLIHCQLLRVLQNGQVLFKRIRSEGGWSSSFITRTKMPAGDFGTYSQTITAASISNTLFSMFELGQESETSGYWISVTDLQWAAWACSASMMRVACQVGCIMTSGWLFRPLDVTRPRGMYIPLAIVFDPLLRYRSWCCALYPLNLYY